MNDESDANNVSRDTVQRVLQVYERAWVQQDPKLIVTIFTEDALYHERIFQEPFRGHEGIANYWQRKVVQEQRDLHFILLSTFVDGTTAVAEWEVYFDDVPNRVRKHMKEVAILQFRGERIFSLREYWAVETVGTF